MMITAVAASLVFSVPFTDPFDSLDNWTVVGGSPGVDRADGNPAPSLKLNNSWNITTFGTQTDSVFLRNPITVDFEDGIIDFDIYFDNDPWAGDTAVITFRMLDSNTYYGASLTNTRDWPSSFIVVRQGEVNQVGNQSQVQAFPTRYWSHVTIVIKGTSLTLLKDGKELLSARDESWIEGKWGGIGIYAAYFQGLFHVDNFSVGDTSIPLTYTSVFTQVVTALTTSTLTFTDSTTSTRTSESLTTVTMTATTTSTVTHSILPIPNYAWIFVGLIGFVLGLAGGYYWQAEWLVPAFIVYGFGMLGFFFSALSQSWLTFYDASGLVVSAVAAPVAGFFIGRRSKRMG
jgi:hypothetical protein